MPKVLVFGQSFNSNTGGGVTLSNLFRGWNKNDLAVICTSHSNGNISSDICDNYYFIGSDEYHWKYPFKYFQRKLPSGKLPIRNTPDLGSFSFKPSFRELVIHKFLYPFLQWSGLMHSISVMEVSNNLLKWVDEFSPDILYVQVSTRESLLFAISLTEKLDIPLIVHQMDDWVSSVGFNGLAGPYWNKKVGNEFKQLIQKADLCLSISDLMGKEYEQRYGSKFITFHNPVDLEMWLPKGEIKKIDNKEISILYAGRTGFGIYDSLIAFADAVEIFNASSELKIMFYVQTAEKLTWTKKYKYTVHKDLIPYNKLPIMFQSMDYLLLPCDFSEKAIRFLKYSMPTKAPEYMISGTPIIILAPEETAIYQYGESSNWAFNINSDDNKIITSRLNEIISNKELKTTITQNAINLAKKRHSYDLVSKEFSRQFEALLKVQIQNDKI